MKMKKQRNAATSLRTQFRAAQAADNAEFELFDSIVRSMPQEIEAFFEMFEKARENLTLPQEIAVLNAVAKGEFVSARGAGLPACLMRWFEVFRDVYIARRLVEERGGRPRGKNPNDFSTFARTFEPLALLPDFWFANDRLVAGRKVRELAHPVRLAFERYLYSSAGCGAWGAMDWEMWRYVQLRIFEPLRSGAAMPLRRIAALALTLRGIVAGELGLHIEERDDVTLPLTGISNAAEQKVPLLKYYHYDRFTQLSFTREHEFAMDVNAGGDHAAFEERWLGLAVISDFIIKESNAHSTLAAVTRAALESFSRCISRTADKIGGNEHRSVANALRLLGDDVDAATGMDARFPDTATLLGHVGVKDSVMRADHYLDAADLGTAERFWRMVMPIFKELRLRFSACHDSTVATYTQKQMSQALARGKNPHADYLKEAIRYGDGSELLSAFGGGGLRNVLKECLAGDEFELQYGVAADVLLGDGCKKGMFSVLSLFTQQGRSIPVETLFGKSRTLQFGEWILDMWTQRATAGRKGGRDYRRIDFRKIVQNADRLWDSYYSNGAEIENRWMASLHMARRLFGEMLENHEDRFVVKANGYRSRNWTEQEIRLMIARLEQERLVFERKGIWEDDEEELKKRVRGQVENTLSTVCGNGDARVFAIYAVLARLMVATARDCFGIWANRAELFSFLTHILCAMSRNPDLPFPWHLGIFNDSYLRLGRTHSRQQNVVDQIVDHDYADSVEQQVLLMFLAHYLKESKAPLEVLDAIAGNEHLCGYFGACRVSFLRSHFE